MTMSDAVELYYARMEAARDEQEDLYFKARPQLMATIEQRTLFNAGFERGFERAYYDRQHPSANSP